MNKNLKTKDLRYCQLCKDYFPVGEHEHENHLNIIKQNERIKIYKILIFLLFTLGILVFVFFNVR